MERKLRPYLTRNISTELINYDFDIGNISKWNVLKVTDMSEMFLLAGDLMENLYLDLSSWSVPLVTTYTDFNKGFESKIVEPTLVNENVDDEYLDALYEDVNSLYRLDQKGGKT